MHDNHDHHAKAHDHCGHKAAAPSCHAHDGHGHAKFDLMFWGSGVVVAAGYLLHWLAPGTVAGSARLETFAATAFEMMNTMWWGILMGVVFVGLLARVPREFVTSVLGRRRGLTGIVRATMGGVLLDLCSHGILMVGAKLYERGATTGQVMAFLIASPWNSFSLTLILFALIGVKWTLAFILLSLVVAIITGLAFDALTAKGVLPANPNTIDIPEDFRFWAEAKTRLKEVKFTPALLAGMLKDGLSDSKIVIRWTLFGVVLAGLIRAFIDAAHFHSLFGPTLAGLALTAFAATIIEVCSEGSTPIAADILNRAAAPGNAFAFLMTGVSTDYTEVMVIKDTTKSWKIALFLPLLTVPQVLLLGWLLNSV